MLSKVKRDSTGPCQNDDILRKWRKRFPLRFLRSRSSREMSRTDTRTTADGKESCNFQPGPWQPEQGGCILTDIRGRLKIPLGPIKIQREACIIRPQPSNLFLSAHSRWRRWAKLRRVYFCAGDEKQTTAEGRWGEIGKSSDTRKNSSCTALVCFQRKFPVHVNTFWRRQSVNDDRPLSLLVNQRAVSDLF